MHKPKPKKRRPAPGAPRPSAHDSNGAPRDTERSAVGSRPPRQSERAPTRADQAPRRGPSRPESRPPFREDNPPRTDRPALGRDDIRAKAPARGGRPTRDVRATPARDEGRDRGPFRDDRASSTRDDGRAKPPFRDDKSRRDDRAPPRRDDAAKPRYRDDKPSRTEPTRSIGQTDRDAARPARDAARPARDERPRSPHGRRPGHDAPTVTAFRGGKPERAAPKPQPGRRPLHRDRTVPADTALPRPPQSGERLAAPGASKPPRRDAPDSPRAHKRALYGPKKKVAPVPARDNRPARPPVATPGIRSTGPAPGGFELPTALVAAWQTTVLAQGKLARGTGSERQLTVDQRMAAIVRQGKGAILELWEIFTQERKELSRSLLNNRPQVVAYLVGFHLANAARMQLALERITQRHGLDRFLRDAPGPLRFHDLGCGSAALAQTFAAFCMASRMPIERLEIHLTDMSGALLDAAKSCFEELQRETALMPPQTHRIALEKLPLERFVHDAGADATDATYATVYGLGYVWNEIDRNPAARSRLQRLFKGHVDRRERAMILLLEPATQDLARDTMALRDELVTAGYVPLYPCPNALPCPMLERSRDWCYSEGLWRQPPIAAAIDVVLGLDRCRISSSIYAMATPEFAAALPGRKPAGEVVVGRPNHRGTAQGKSREFDYLLCSDGKLNKASPTPGKSFRLRGESLTTQDAKRIPSA